MKTNYKQSQAAPHAKPIFTVSRNDSTLYVLPAYLAGAVMIRLQHIADTHEGLCTVRRVRAALSRTVRGRKPADTPPRRYNAGANTKRKQ